MTLLTDRRRLTRLAAASLGGSAKAPTILYVIALLLIACAVISSHLLLSRSLAGSDADSAIINRSGWQRTHAERTVRLAGELINERDAAIARRLKIRLGASLDAMRRSHEWLRAKIRELEAQAPPEKDLRSAYFGGVRSLDATLREYFANTQAVLSAEPAAYSASFAPYREMVDAHRTGLVSDLDAVVHIHERMARERIERFRSLETLLLFVTLGLLLAEALFIFRPLIQRLVKANRELTSRNRLMSEMAVSDTLTRLPNRSGFGERLKHLIDAQAGADRCAAVMMLDLDRFKNVNDKYGHPAGDRVLIEVGNRIAALLRECDTVARLGGDEFAVILRKLDRPGQASATAERIIDAVGRPIMLREGEVSVGTSIGITIFQGTEGSSQELLTCADLALAEAKRGGKGCYRFYDPAMQERVSRKHAMAEKLERAFDEGQIRVYLQPILSLETGAVAFAESLVRWDDGTPGPLAAGDFIDVIDEFQLAARLEKAVFGQVFAMMRRWADDGIDHPAVTLNLSAADLRSSTFCDRIMAAVEEYRLRPDMLALEILETALFERGAETVENNIHRLSDLGFRIMLDNFGVGHASLTHLMRLPVDDIKIDRSLIGQSDDRGSEETVARAVLGLADGLGIHAIAEGVEHTHQLSWLMGMKCDYGQGYFFHAPIPLETFDLYLRGGVFASSEREGLARYRSGIS